jgi:5-(carboxyamino)imidazole ribonucleotide synthase
MGSIIAARLEHVGMIAVEMFVTTDGRLLINEVAPRTHNSGHYTLGACATSQFEQHIRAICGLPLGDTTLLRPAVMLNLLGDAWHEGQPDWSTLLCHPNARLHIYGKRVAAPGRKMGHVLVLDSSTDAAWQVATEVGDLLQQQQASRATA